MPNNPPVSRKTPEMKASTVSTIRDVTFAGSGQVAHPRQFQHSYNRDEVDQRIHQRHIDKVVVAADRGDQRHDEHGLGADDVDRHDSIVDRRALERPRQRHRDEYRQRGQDQNGRHLWFSSQAIFRSISPDARLAAELSSRAWASRWSSSSSSVTVPGVSVTELA